MGTYKQYSKEFKEAIVKKLLNRGSQTVSEFCSLNNLKPSTVNGWLMKCANTSGMKSKTNSSKHSSEKILKIIAETYSLNEEDLGVYLRQNGLHSNQLTEWRSSFLSSVNQPKLNLNKKDERDTEIKDLKKNGKLKILIKLKRYVKDGMIKR